MPSLAIFPLPLPIPKSSTRSPSSRRNLNIPDPFLPLSIRMGGGPRTFPGGVSKWQWKRMQAKKSKQILKARLCRERQIYEMRKRAELKSAIAELEKPWEEVERAPVLFPVDEQIKALADRFQRSGGFDMWSERDGPRIFAGNLSHRFGENGKEWGNQESVVSGSKIDGQFDRHWGLDSSRFERHKRDSDSYGSESDSRMRSSYGSNSKLKKEDNEGEISKRSAHRNASAGGFDRRSGNRGSYRSDSELALADSRSDSSFERHSDSYGSQSDSRMKSSYGSNSKLKKEDNEGEISNRSAYGNASAGGFDRRSGHRGSYRSDSELALADSRSDSSFERHSDSYGSQSDSRMQSSYGSNSKLKKEDKEGEISNRSAHRNASAGGFDRRSGNRGSYRSDSDLGSKIDGQFDRRGSNRGSYRRDSDLAGYGSKMNGNDMFRHWGLDSRFDDSYKSQSDSRMQSSNRSNSKLKKEDKEGEISNRSAYRNASAGGFHRRSGNRVSYRSDSELAFSRHRNASAGGSDRRGGRGGNQGSYRPDSGYRNASAGGFDRRGGGGGGNRNSYGLESEIENGGFRKGRIQNAGGRGRDYRDEGRVLLRPTTELRMEEGDDERRVRKWNEGRNKGFRSSRGTRRS